MRAAYFRGDIKKARPQGWRERQAVGVLKKCGARSFPRGQAAGAFPEALKRY
jgi:hypothetical protein